MSMQVYNPEKHKGKTILEVHSGYDEDSGISFKYMAPVKNIDSVDPSLVGYYWVEVEGEEQIEE